MTEASRSLDVGETGLRRWVDQLKAERSGITPVSKALTPDQQRIQELETRVSRLEREKNHTKKDYCSLNVGRMESYQLRELEPVDMVCQAFSVPPASYYDYHHQKRHINIQRLELKAHVIRTFNESRGSAGSRMIQSSLAIKVCERGVIASVH